MPGSVLLPELSLIAIDQELGQIILLIKILASYYYGIFLKAYTAFRKTELAAQ